MSELREVRSHQPEMMEYLGSLKLPWDGDGALDKKSCCAALYELEPVRILLGETLHPGGLALTQRLGRLAGIGRDDTVLDVACGRGASALAVARSFHCRVVGVDLGAGAVGEASRLARESNMGGRVSFLRGDGEGLPLRGGSFDVVLSECSMSLFADKAAGMAEIARLLRPGGRVGISDVTVEPGCLPQELTGALGQMLCLAGAPSVDGYRELFGRGSLNLVHQEDATSSVLKLLGDLEGKLATFRMLVEFQDRSGEVPDLISRAYPIIEMARGLVNDGSIGYRLFVAERGA